MEDKRKEKKTGKLKKMTVKKKNKYKLKYKTTKCYHQI